jgi:hypothetical protein
MTTEKKKVELEHREDQRIKRSRAETCQKHRKRCKCKNRSMRYKITGNR